MLLWLPCRESFGLAGISTASHAETGSVAVVFTKGGLILGVGRR